MSMSLWGIIKGLLVQDETDRSKELSLEVNPASTTGTRVTLKSGIQAVNATITLPITSDTLVGKATTDVLTNKSFDADGTGNSITNIENADIKAAAAIDASKLADGSVSNTELQYINSLSSNAQDQLDATASSISNHISDSSDAHDASSISNVPSGNLVATEVQTALNELQSDVDSRALNSDLTNHVNDVSSAHTASAIANVPAGNLASTDVQAALNELQSDIDFLTPGGGANTSLSNLSSTAVNADIIPDITGSRSLGTSSLLWSDIHVQNQTFSVAGIKYTAVESSSINDLPMPSGTNVNFKISNGTSGQNLGITTTPSAIASGSLLLETGNGIAGNSGNIILQTGTATGTRGKFKFKDGSEGTVGQVWTQSVSDGTGVWSAPSPMTTGGDIIYGGVSGVSTRLPNGTIGQVLTSSGGTTAPSWTTPTTSNLTVASKTANYTLTTSDDVILCSGTTFTLTLPTAVGITGKQFIIKHQGSLLADSYTLNTTGGQTINGILSGFYELRTQNETLKIISDGANWQILEHISNVEWVSAGTNTITATTTNPTKGTVNYDYFQWRRSGTNMEFRIGYNQTAAGAAGSGLYLWAIPPGAFADTTYAQDNGASITNLNADNIGFGVVSDNANSQAANTNSAKAFLYNTTNIAIKYEGSSGIDLALNASNTQNFGDTNFSVKITGSIPILGWRP